jgi:hypothetical protein
VTALEVMLLCICALLQVAPLANRIVETLAVVFQLTSTT